VLRIFVKLSLLNLVLYFCLKNKSKILVFFKFIYHVNVRTRFKMQVTLFSKLLCPCTMLNSEGFVTFGRLTSVANGCT
jgi:hypothetical protein